MEQSIFIKRLYDLAGRAYNNNCFTFTDFLTPAEISDFYGISRDGVFKGYKVFGGFEEAERAVIRFGDEEEFGYNVEFPIVNVKVSPLIMKFADNLSHRDVLGAIMNLGITREMIGDIVLKNNIAYIMVLDKMADYIVENLTKIKHTNVRAEIDNDVNISDSVELQEKNIIASSVRIDGIISKIYNLSRNESINLFREKKIFVNSRLCENNSYQLKNGDVISVRGYGKFIFDETGSMTRSGRYNIRIRIYV